MQLDDYVDMIDQTVTRWLTSDEANKDSNKRTLLALYSYDLTNIFENKTLIQTNLEDYKCEFYRLQVILINGTICPGYFLLTVMLTNTF